MRKRKIIRRALWVLLLVFIILNVVTFFHAYKFTHFDADEKQKLSADLSITQKIAILFSGIDLPRPQNISRPNRIYKTIRMKSNKLIEGWLIETNYAKGTIIIFHGYGGSKSSMLDKSDTFLSMGYNTFLVDFMGAGGSEGNQTTIGFLEAYQVKTSYDYIARRGEENIILFGTSMGAAAIMKAVSDHKLSAEKIILECPFGTMLQTVKNRFASLGIPSFPLAHLLIFWGGIQNDFNAFENNPCDYAKNITLPVLLFYGEKDVKVTPGETRDIYKNLNGPKKLVTFPEAGHENYLNKYGKQWSIEIEKFLRTRH